VIGEREREAWLAQMTAAVRSLDLAPQVQARLLEYFEVAAAAMVNSP
jgi:truncated hemoglobin YjbI